MAESADDFIPKRNYEPNNNADVWTGATDGPKTQSFYVRPFTSGSAVEEMFSFAQKDAGEGISLSSSGEDGFLDEEQAYDFRGATSNSIASAITELSQHSPNAMPTTFPLPSRFNDRPGLPHVDEFVNKSKLGYDHLRMMTLFEKKAAFLKARLKAPKSVNFIGPESVADPLGGGGSYFHMGSGVGSPSVGNYSTLSIKQVRLFIKCIQYFGEIDPNSDKYHGMTYTDVETALRMHARSTSVLQEGKDDPTELLMAAFEDLLIKVEQAPTQWFQINCMQVAGNEPKMTKEMFHTNVRKMCRLCGLPEWTNHDMRQLRLHLSRDGETEPTMNGVLRAFRRYNAMTEEKEILVSAKPIIDRILRLMKKRKIRLIDFFSYIGADPSAPVQPRLLADSIHKLLGTKSAVPLHSPPKGLRAREAAGMGLSAVSAVSLSSPGTPSRDAFASRSLSLSRAQTTASHSLLLRSSMAGKPPGKKSGTEAVKPDELPPEVLDHLEHQQHTAQTSLHTNGSVYTNSVGKKKLSVIASIRRGDVGGNVNAGLPTGRLMSALGGSEKGQPLGHLKGHVVLEPLGTARGGGGSQSPQAPSTAPALGRSGKGNQPPPPPNWTSLTFSKNFAELTKKRTAVLIGSFSTYDRKREHHRHELAAFF